MAGLTSHVLDTVRGAPAAGVEITVYRLDGESRSQAGWGTTGAGGRTDPPLLDRSGLEAGGTLELHFHAGAYFIATGTASGGLFDVVPVRLTVPEGTSSLHVPLLISPWSYTTYRGS